MHEREGLMGRIRQLRRGSAESEEPAQPGAGGPGPDELRALAVRVGELEELVQGLQDSVHRETTRLGKRLGEVETRIQPAALGRALSDDARERGQLRADADYYHARVALLRAKLYRWGLGSTPRLKALERELELAQQRLRDARLGAKP